MNVLNIFIPIALLISFLYALILLTLGIAQMLGLVADNMHDYNKHKGVRYYINFFFIKKVNKSISHIKIIAVSTISAIVIYMAIIVTHK